MRLPCPSAFFIFFSSFSCLMLVVFTGSGKKERGTKENEENERNENNKRRLPSLVQALPAQG
jgi:hypothetical protein